MKKIVAILCILIIMFCLVLNKDEENGSQYFRIHIRANSNSSIDQRVKYEVKEAVEEYLTPFISKVSSFEEAKDVATESQEYVEELIDAILKNAGFDYSSSVKITNEYFPKRSYDDLILDAGYYDAIIVELGEGQGDNWWCVVYPPLCFVGGKYVDGRKIEYRSYFLEVLQKFLAKTKANA